MNEAAQLYPQGAASAVSSGPRVATVRAVFGSILMLCLLLRLRYGHTLWTLDEFAYLNAALDANEKGWPRFLLEISTIYENRVSLISPLAAAMKLFGATEFAIEALGLGFSLGAIAVTFAIAKRLHGELAAWTSAVLIASIPQEIWTSLSVTPDTAMPFYTGAAMFALLRAQERRLDTLSVGWYAASASAAFCAFEARATGGVILGVMGLWGLLQPRLRIVRAAIPVLFFFGIVAAFWGILGAIGGDYAIQLRQLVTDGTGTPWTGTGRPFQHLFFMLPVVRLMVELPALLGRHAPIAVTDLARYAVNTLLGLYYYLIWPAVAYAAFQWRRLPSVRLSLVAFAFLYLFFEFGSTSLTSYQPIWKFERFLTILSVPSAVIGGVVFADLLPRIRSAHWGRIASWSVPLLYIVSSILILEADRRFWGDTSMAARQTFVHLKEVSGPSRTIFVMSESWAERGRAMLRLSPPQLPGRFEQLENQALDAIHNAIVIVDRSYLEPWAHYHDKTDKYDPRLKANPAGLPGWKMLFETPLLTFERQRSEIRVFAVP